MVSTIEIYRAIRERLESAFPKILIQQKDIKNITHPSFYIQYIGKNFDRQASEFYEDRISFNIVYFAENESLLELLEIEEAFIFAFNTPLTITDDTNIVEVEKNSIQSDLNEDDYFLNMTIDFVLMQRQIKDESALNDLENIGLKIVNDEDETIYLYNDWGYLKKDLVQNTKTEIEEMQKKQFFDLNL